MQSLAPSMPTPASDPETSREPIFRRCGFCRGWGRAESLGVDLMPIGERECFFCEGTGKVIDYAAMARRDGGAA